MDRATCLEGSLVWLAPLHWGVYNELSVAVAVVGFDFEEFAAAADNFDGDVGYDDCWSS